MTSNVRFSFPLTTSNSFQVPSPYFPSLQHLKFFIQASKSNLKKKILFKFNFPKVVIKSNFLLGVENGAPSLV